MMSHEDAVNKKRNADSVASASASSKSKRFRRSSPEILEDSQALNRNLRRFENPASPGPSTPIVQGNRNTGPDVVEQFRAEITELRRQQAIDREHFEFALNAHNGQLGDLWRAMARTPTREPLRQSESEESTVKSEEDDMETNLYDATPEPRGGSQPNNHEQTPKQWHDRFEEDPTLPKITPASIKLYDGMRMPELIENLPPVPDLQLSQQPNETFTFDFLKRVLGGKAVSSGLWLVPTKTREKRLFPQLKSFRTLNSDFDPLLPRRPGEHGARLSCVLAEIEDEHLTFPMFIRRGQGGYKYYGTYREPRYSDRLGGNEMRQVPEYVKKQWASQIGATRRDGKIPKHNDAIREAWPKVLVGWLTDNYKRLFPYQEKLHDDFEENPVTRPITADEADQVGEGEILKAFETADADDAPSMRLFYEYLQCVGYDHDFYKKLVAKKLELGV